MMRPVSTGEMAEWFKAHAWNACIRETVSRVRIPLSPPALTDFAEVDKDTGSDLEPVSRQEKHSPEEPTR
jgi:hypothetical protein